MEEGDGNQRAIFQPAEGSSTLTLHTFPPPPHRRQGSSDGTKSQLYKHSLPLSQGTQLTCQKGELGKTAKEQLFPEENMK